MTSNAAVNDPLEDPTIASIARSDIAPQDLTHYEIPGAQRIADPVAVSTPVPSAMRRPGHPEGGGSTPGITWSRRKRLAKQFPGPSEFALAVLEGKWKSTILCCLMERSCRYADLRRLVPRLSDKMLSNQLNALMDTGLVLREKLTPSAQVYALTPRGRSLMQVLRLLSAWGLQNAEAFGVRIASLQREREPL